MLWLRRNWVGVLGMLLALIAVGGGVESLRAGIRRDQQAAAIPRRLERGEADLAEQHRKSVAVLSEYADVTGTVAFSFTGLAATAVALSLARSRPSLWLIGITVVLSIGAVALAFVSRAKVPQASEVVADSVSGFSSEQGANGWSYGYWDHTADPDKSYDPKTDFQLLKHFGSDPINHISGRPEFTTGKLWNLEDGKYYTSLWAEGGHPNSMMKLGTHAQVEQWAVRRWVSTVDGPVTISGHAGKVMPWGENWAGGCQALIVVDGAAVFSAAMDNRGTDYSINVNLKKGSTVDFLIGPGPSIGVTKFTATIRTTPDLKPH